MEKRAFQLFIVVLLLLTLQLFDYTLNQQQPSAIPVTGAAVSDSQTATCAEAAPCKSPASWKCQSNSRCYDYSDCLFQCPSTPSTPGSEKKDEQPAPTCTCGDWQTIGGCGEQGCPTNKLPQSKSCAGGASCKTENRCVESAQCKADQPTSQRCVDYKCVEDNDHQGVQYCSFRCAINGERYESSECEQKCAEAAKAAASEGVNLVPELTVTLPQGQTTVKGGEKIRVMLKVKNAGNKDADSSGLKGVTSFKNIIYFYKEREFGDLAIDTIIADFPLGQAKILVGGSEVAIAEREVTVPAGFSGTLVIAAVVDSQDNFRESPAGETDNRQVRQIAVELTSAAPNLVPVAAETSPPIEAFPTTLSSIKVKIKNIGAVDAEAQKQFLQNDVTIKRDNTIVCRHDVNSPRRDIVTIKPGDSGVREFLIPLKATDGFNQCVITDSTANYWAIVDADTLKAVTESDETDNTKTFQLKGPQQCSPLGSRQAGQYCNIATATWLTQKKAGDSCSHNFECETDLCICENTATPCAAKKCVDSSKRDKVIQSAWG